MILAFFTILLFLIECCMSVGIIGANLALHSAHLVVAKCVVRESQICWSPSAPSAFSHKENFFCPNSSCSRRRQHPHFTLSLVLSLAALT